MESHWILVRTYRNFASAVKNCNHWFQPFKSGNFNFVAKHTWKSTKKSLKKTHYKHYLTKTIHINKRWWWCTLISLGKPYIIAWKTWERFKRFQNAFHTNWTNDRCKDQKLTANCSSYGTKERVFCIGLQLAMKKGHTLKITNARIPG